MHSRDTKKRNVPPIQQDFSTSQWYSSDLGRGAPLNQVTCSFDQEIK